MINRNYLNTNVLPIAPPINNTAYSATNDIPHPSNKIYPTPITPSALVGARITLPTGFETGATAGAGITPLGIEVGDILLNVNYSDTPGATGGYGTYTSVVSIIDNTSFAVRDPWYNPGNLSAFLLFKPGCRGGAIFELPNGFSRIPTELVTVKTMGGTIQSIFIGRGPLPQQMPLSRNLLFRDDNASTPTDTRTLINGGYLLAFYN